MKDILLAILVILLAGVAWHIAHQESKHRSQVDLYEYNLAALDDSLRTYMTAEEELVYTTRSLIATNEELKHLNAKLAKKGSSLGKQVVTISDIKTVTVTDTYYMPIMTVLNIDTFDFRVNDTVFHNIDNYTSTHIDFQVIILRPTGNDTITESLLVDKMRVRQETAVSLTTGLTETNGVLEIFVLPNHPGLTITQLEGAFINPRDSEVIRQFFPDKRWVVGPFLGFGYSATSQGLHPGISAGISLQYRLISF